MGLETQFRIAGKTAPETLLGSSAKLVWWKISDRSNKTVFNTPEILRTDVMKMARKFGCFSAANY